MEPTIPWLLSAFGVILSGLVGMAVKQLGSIENNLALLSDKFYHHLTQSSIHESGFARTDEQIKSLCAMVSKAHERIDRLAEART